MRKLYLYTVLGALGNVEFPPDKGTKEVEDTATKEKSQVVVPFERSGEGALYLRPGSTYELTDDEFEHIKAAYPKVAAQLQFQAEVKAQPESESAPAAPPSGGNESGSGENVPPGSNDPALGGNKPPKRSSSDK